MFFHPRITWVLFKVMVYFPGKSTMTGGIYSEYVLFFGGPLKQIQE